MSPEVSLPATEILDESARIVEFLLAIEEKATQAARTERAYLLTDVRARLGYAALADSGAEAVVDNRIEGKDPVITPEALSYALPLTRESVRTTQASRLAIGDILIHKDDRLLVVVGPCSIHDPRAALEYADHVSKWRESHGENLEIVMRFYPEKPRSEREWKGFISDPYLDESDDANVGIAATRLLASKITGEGVPIAMERLNALTPQYVSGLVAYDAIGARNTTDQKSREYASGTSSPVGFKNTTDGNIEAAVQAVVSARGSHSFLGIEMDGILSQVRTAGNELAHIILRGSSNGPNFAPEHIETAKQLLEIKNIRLSIGIDASHGNSRKKADNQPAVVRNISQQISNGERSIVMVMIEGHLVDGQQSLKHADKTLKRRDELVYGQSITDECSGIDQTLAMLEELESAVIARRQTVPVG
jgi:3-deoxy-7-phosphoheptulonate synthase